MTNQMTRQRVIAVVAAARIRGERPNLHGLDLSGIDLSNVDLSHADLRNANLICTDLRSADLTGAILRGAILRGAILHHAILTDADLTGADLRKVILNALFLDGLPSGQLIFVPTPDGWHLTIGCWTGTTDTLREMIAGDNWPEAMDEDIAGRRPMLIGAADMCDAFAAMNNHTLAGVKKTAEYWKEIR